MSNKHIPKSKVGNKAAATKQPPPVLPKGWSTGVDPASGRTYYLDNTTKSTHWTPPAVPAPMTHHPTPAPAPTGYTAADLEPGWRQSITTDGKVFFLNDARQMTQWEAPLRKKAAPAGRAGADDSANDSAKDSSCKPRKVNRVKPAGDSAQSSDLTPDRVVETNIDSAASANDSANDSSNDSAVEPSAQHTATARPQHSHSTVTAHGDSASAQHTATARPQHGHSTDSKPPDTPPTAQPQPMTQPTPTRLAPRSRTVRWVLPTEHTDTWVNKKIAEGLLATAGGGGAGPSVLSGPSYYYPIFSEPLPTADVIPGPVVVRVSVQGSSNCVLGIASGLTQRRTFQKSKECYGLFMGGMSNGEVFTAGVRSRRSWRPKSYECPCVVELTIDTAACTLAVRLLPDPARPAPAGPGDEHESHVTCTGLPAVTAFRVCAGTYSHDCKLTILSVTVGDGGPAHTGDVAYDSSSGAATPAGAPLRRPHDRVILNDFQEPTALASPRISAQSPEWDYAGSDAGDGMVANPLHKQHQHPFARGSTDT